MHLQTTTTIEGDESMNIVTIKLPGRVWDDYLDSGVSGMAAEIGLPDPMHVKHGKGTRTIYQDVPADKAGEVADYLADRANLLLGQGISDPYDVFEKRDRDTHRAAIKAADEIRRHIKAVA